MLYRFIIYGLLGWNVEILWTGFCGLVAGDYNMVGHTSLWMFLIYASGGLFFECVLRKIRDRNWYERGLIWIYMIFIIEFLSGMFLKAIGIEAWKYDSLFSVAGLIRLDYAPLWLIVGFIFERVNSLIIERKL